MRLPIVVGRKRKPYRMVKGSYYVTTFCNFAHDTKTGRPIDHECYILPPTMIQAERDGDMEKAGNILAEYR